MIKVLYTLSNEYFSSCCNIYSFAEKSVRSQQGATWQTSSNKADILTISQMLKFINNLRTLSDLLVAPNKLKRKRDRILNYRDFPLLNCKRFDPGFETLCGAGNNITCIVIIYYQYLK